MMHTGTFARHDAFNTCPTPHLTHPYTVPKTLFSLHLATPYRLTPSVLACDTPDKDVFCRGCYGKKYGAHG